MDTEGWSSGWHKWLAWSSCFSHIKRVTCTRQCLQKAVQHSDSLRGNIVPFPLTEAKAAQGPEAHSTAVFWGEAGAPTVWAHCTSWLVRTAPKHHPTEQGGTASCCSPAGQVSCWAKNAAPKQGQRETATHKRSLRSTHYCKLMSSTTIQCTLNTHAASTMRSMLIYASVKATVDFLKLQPCYHWLILKSRKFWALVTMTTIP